MRHSIFHDENLALCHQYRVRFCHIMWHLSAFACNKVDLQTHVESVSLRKYLLTTIYMVWLWILFNSSISIRLEYVYDMRDKTAQKRNNNFCVIALPYNSTLSLTPLFDSNNFPNWETKHENEHTRKRCI